MQKTFTYEFDIDKPNSLQYELSMEEDERMSSSVQGGAPVLYMNRSAMLTMAKLLIKMASGDRSEQFHVHLHKDFGNAEDAVTIVLSSDTPVHIAEGDVSEL